MVPMFRISEHQRYQRPVKKYLCDISTATVDKFYHKNDTWMTVVGCLGSTAVGKCCSTDSGGAGTR